MRSLYRHEEPLTQGCALVQESGSGCLVRESTAKTNIGDAASNSEIGPRRLSLAHEMQNTGETALSGAVEPGGDGVRGCSSSERAQQNSADERKHGEHGQHIEPQGKVHVTPPVLTST